MIINHHLYFLEKETEAQRFFLVSVTRPFMEWDPSEPRPMILNPIETARGKRAILVAVGRTNR